MPEGVVGGAIYSGQRLPVVQEGAEPIYSATPIVALGKPFGLFDHGFLGLPRRLALLCTLGLASLGLLAEQGRQGVELRREAGQITDRIGLLHTLSHGADRVPGFIRRQGPIANPHHEQVHLDLKGLEAPHVERECVGWRNVGDLTDAALAVGRTHVHRAVGVDATEVGRT